MKSLTKKYGVLATISVLFIFFFLIIVDVQYTLKNINSQLDRDAKNCALYVEELVNNIIGNLNTISKTPALKSKDAQLVSNFLFDLSNTSKANAFVIADSNGMRWAGTKKVYKPYDISKSEVFQGVYKTGKIYITGAGKARFNNEIEFIIGYPIFDKQKKLENVLYAPVYASNFKTILSNIKLESNGNLHIIDNQGYLLLSTKEDLKQLKKYGHNLQEKSDLAAGIFLNYDNKQITAFEKIKGTTWSVIVDTDVSAAAKYVAKKVLLDVVIFLLVLLPVVFVFYIILRQINNQNKELVNTNRKLKSLATTDGLTGLFNHRAFQEQLSQQLALANTKNQLTLIMMDIDNFKIFNDSYGHQIGDKVLKHLSYILKDYFKKTGIVARYGGEEFAVILPDTDYEKGIKIAKDLSEIIKSTCFKVDESVEAHIGVSIGIASYPKNASDRENLIRFADQALYLAKEEVSNKVQMYYSALEELRDSIDDHDVLKIVYTLNTIINAKDKYTFHHSERVMNYAVRIAKCMGLSQEEITNITIGALLHDIGKIEVSGNILNKTTRLSLEEFEHIKQHPIVGSDIIKPLKSLEKAMPFVLYHHERYDGKGYPYGLKGDKIPLFGRIAAVADSYDAMTSKRPYQKAKSNEEAIEELKSNSGSQFDPEIVNLFIKQLLETKNTNLG